MHLFTGSCRTAVVIGHPQGYRIDITGAYTCRGRVLRSGLGKIAEIPEVAADGTGGSIAEIDRRIDADRITGAGGESRCDHIAERDRLRCGVVAGTIVYDQPNGDRGCCHRERHGHILPAGGSSIAETPVPGIDAIATGMRQNNIVVHSPSSPMR